MEEYNQGYNQGKEEMMPITGAGRYAMPVMIMYVPVMVSSLGLPGGGLYGGNNFYGNIFSERKEPYLERTRNGDYVLNKSALDALLDKYTKSNDKEKFTPGESLHEQ